MLLESNGANKSGTAASAQAPPPETRPDRFGPGPGTLADEKFAG